LFALKATVKTIKDILFVMHPYFSASPSNFEKT